MTKRHIKTMGCFQQVAAVLGESRAQLELWLVVHANDPKYINSTGLDIDVAFIWSDTPQDDKFWRNIASGIHPDTGEKVL